MCVCVYVCVCVFVCVCVYVCVCVCLCVLVCARAGMWHDVRLWVRANISACVQTLVRANGPTGGGGGKWKRSVFTTSLGEDLH